MGNQYFSTRIALRYNESIKNIMKVKEEEKIKKLRICKRCLLQDFDESAYYEKIYKLILIMEPSMKATDKVYRERLQLCKECDKLQGGTCLACGCFVELRAVMKKSHCPYKKW